MHLLPWKHNRTAMTQWSAVEIEWDQIPFFAVQDTTACCITQHRSRSEVPLDFGVMHSESIYEVQRGPVLILVADKAALEQPFFW